MALPASDSFTYANSITLAGGSGGAWALGTASTTMGINTNAVYPTGGECSDYWTADTPGNDHYTQITIVALTAAGYVGPAIRVATGADTRYGYYASTTDSYFFKSVAGTWTQLGSTGAACAVNDVLYIQASGTGLTGKKNGSTTFTQTDSAIASGRLGVTGFASSPDTGARLDTWSGDNLGAAATGPFPPWPLVQRIIVRG
jgi:hypothetical protein